MSSFWLILNVIFYQNMPNLHNRYKSAERKISQKNAEYMLNYFLSSFWLIRKQQWTIKISSLLFSIFSLAAILVGSRDHRTQFWKGAIQGPSHQSLVQIGPVASEELIKMWTINGRTDDGRSVVTIAHRSGELKMSRSFLQDKHFHCTIWLSSNLENWPLLIKNNW